MEPAAKDTLLYPEACALQSVNLPVGHWKLRAHAFKKPKLDGSQRIFELDQLQQLLLQDSCTTSSEKGVSRPPARLSSSQVGRGCCSLEDLETGSFLAVRAPMRLGCGVRLRGELEELFGDIAL